MGAPSNGRYQTLHGERVPVAELCENIRNFEDMATYYRYTRSAQNIQRYNFTLATTVLNTEVGDDCATVELAIISSDTISTMHQVPPTLPKVT